MRKIFSILLISTFFLGCKDGKSGPENIPETDSIENVTTLSTAQSIAKAYGIDQWSNVEELNFTFNLELPNRRLERSYRWKPKTNEVTYMALEDTIQYDPMNALDSLQIATDQRFINDKYWLLAPFQLVWDENLTFIEQFRAIAPISKDSLHLLTAVYPNVGGYTPGDAYDFYYNDDYVIKEWVYRAGNQPEPSLITTWEDIQEYSEVKLTRSHKDSTQNFHLHFTNLSIH